MSSLTTDQIWHYVHQERRRLVTDLSDLPDTAWESPSLCEGWSVHDVLAHLLDTAGTSRSRSSAT